MFNTYALGWNLRAMAIGFAVAALLAGATYAAAIYLIGALPDEAGMQLMAVGTLAGLAGWMAAPRSGELGK